MATITWTSCIQKLGSMKAAYLDPYIPSKDDCLARATQTVQTVASPLPPKGGTAAIALLDQQIRILQGPANQDTVTAATRLEIQQQKTSLIGQYESICGKHFEDKSSQIDQAWANFSREETSYNASSVTQFDQVRPDATDGSLPVSTTFQQFLQLEQRGRDTLQRIIDLGASMNSDPELLAALTEEKRLALETHNALFGSYDGDPAAALTKAKNEYDASLLHNTDSITSAGLLDIYKGLQKQHAENVRTIYLIDQMLTAPARSDARLDAIVAQKIQTAVDAVQRQIVAQQQNVGVDWKRTSIYTITGVATPVVAAYSLSFYYGSA
jgi:hypothetical protein